MSSTDDTDSQSQTKPNIEAIKPPDKSNTSKPLSPIETMFVKNYATPSSSTFANGVQSYLAIKPHVEYSTAAVQASDYLNRPYIADSITDILNKASLGIEVRADSLKRIVSHRDIGKSTSRVRHTEDETVTTTESGPAYRDVLKSIDLLNKIDGTYDRNRAAADVASTEYKQLVRRFFSTMEQRPRRARGGGGRGSPVVSNVSLLPTADEKITEGGLSGKVTEETTDDKSG